MYFAWLKWLIESWNSKKVSPVNISRGEPPITGVVSGHDHTGVPRHMIIDASPEQSIYCCSHTRPVTVFSHNSSRWLFLWWCWQCWVCHQPRRTLGEIRKIFDSDHHHCQARCQHDSQCPTLNSGPGRCVPRNDPLCEVKSRLSFFAGNQRH